MEIQRDRIPSGFSRHCADHLTQLFIQR